MVVRSTELFNGFRSPYSRRMVPRHSVPEQLGMIGERFLKRLAWRGAN